MSTRATYQIEGKYSKATYYIHYDGYPEGGAVYFWNMLHEQNHRGGYTTQFLRANELAEVTSGHEVHSDTEFRYTLKDEFVNVLGRSWIDEEGGKEWKGVFSGNVHEFINRYGKESIDDFKPYHEMESGKWFTETEARDNLASAIHELVTYRNKFPDMSGNISYHESTVSDCREILKSIESEKVVA